MESSPVLTLATETTVKTYVLPDPPLSSPKRTPLSITESPTIRYHAPHAIWFFSAPPASTPRYRKSAFLKSLAVTLSSYPQLAGKLYQIPFSSSQPANQHARGGRLVVHHGYETDPGVAVTFSESKKSSLELLGPTEPRGNIWEAGPQDEVLEPLSGSELKIEGHDAPVEMEPLLASSSDNAGTWTSFATTRNSPKTTLVTVKITTFSNNAFAIAVRASHPVADARTLATFVRDWGDVHRALLIQAKPPILNVIFAPEALDAAAAGDINTTHADPSLVSIARSLPVHRYDAWTSDVDGCPEFVKPLVGVPKEFKEQGMRCKESEGENGIPWDPRQATEAELKYYTFHFTARKVEDIQEAIVSAEVDSRRSPISKLDAIQAVIWALVVRARNLVGESQNVSLDSVLGLRARLQPALSLRTAGVPALIIKTESPGTDFALPPTGNENDLSSYTKGLSRIARRLRDSVDAMTPKASAAFLHDKAYQIDAHRYWQTVPTEKHIIATSWTHIGLYDVDFGGESGPEWVEVMMPGNVICIYEGKTKELSPGVRRTWYSSGVKVGLRLAADVMGSLLEDPLLRSIL